MVLFFVLVAVFSSRGAKCPRCGKRLEEGHCPYCAWPEVQCPSCGNAVLVDGICPNCGLAVPGRDDIRYTEVGAMRGGFGVIYPAILNSDGKWTGGAMLKRFKSYAEIGNDLMAVDEYRARRAAIDFEGTVLEYLRGAGYKNCPNCHARGVAAGKGVAWTGPWYLMEKARGESLEAWRLKNRVFSRQTHGRILYALCEGLSALHGLGVAHRDFKPENIFWDADAGKITLIDFGNASMPEHENPQNGLNVAISRYWIPDDQPNVIQLRRIDETSDIYAFGLVACAMALGCAHTSRGEVVQRRAELVSKVGEKLANLLIDWALAEDHTMRRKALKLLLGAMRESGWGVPQ